MEDVLMLSWLASFAAGLAGLINPRWVRLPSRWTASALLSFSIVFVTAAGEFFPSPDAKQAEGTTAGFLGTWAFLCGVVILVRLAVSAQRMANYGVLAEPLGLIDKMAAKWATFIINHRQRQKSPSINPKPVRPSPPPESRITIGATLEFNVAEERRNVAEQRKEAAAPRHDPAVRSFGSDDYYLEIGDEGEHGRIIRTGWGQDPLMFEYADYHGVLTVRTIHKWVEYPQYIQGWCEDQEDTRTFRKSRVQTWFGGTETMLRGPKGRSRL